MKNTWFIFKLTLVFALLFSRLSFAGTLDDAPFRIVVPTSEWRIDDSKAQPMGQDVFMVATIGNTNTVLKSVVVKTILDKPSAGVLDELCAGMRDSFANPAIKVISDTNTIFLGYKARTFVYQVTQGEQVGYNEAILFVAGKNAWTIAFMGQPNQKEEIKKLVGFYRNK